MDVLQKIDQLLEEQAVDSDPVSRSKREQEIKELSEHVDRCIDLMYLG